MAYDYRLYLDNPIRIYSLHKKIINPSPGNQQKGNCKLLLYIYKLSIEQCLIPNNCLLVI